MRKRGQIFGLRVYRNKSIVRRFVSSSLRLHPAKQDWLCSPAIQRVMELVTRYRSATVADSNSLPWHRAFPAAACATTLSFKEPVPILGSPTSAARKIHLNSSLALPHSSLFSPDAGFPYRGSIFPFLSQPACHWRRGLYRLEPGPRFAGKVCGCASDRDRRFPFR